MQEVIFENLFYIEDGYVTVFRFLKRKKKFEYLKRDGSKSHPSTDDFWIWWKEASDFVEGSDKVDFCFIYDGDNSVSTEIFQKDVLIGNENSCWNQEAIKSFFNEMVDYTHVELSLPNGRQVKYEKENQLFGGKLNTKKKFFTNINLEDNSVVLKSKTKEEVSPFALYFKELRRREKKI